MDLLTTAILELQEIALLTWRALRRSISKPFYVRETVQQLDMIGVGSLPIIILAGFFIGGVLSLNTASTLRSFGAQNFTGQLVMTSLIRELGPVLTSIIVAGRIGSAIAAELGSMLVSEQIDAMRAMGTDPIKKLVVPRMLGCMIMTPALTVISVVVGALGGWVVAKSILGIASSVYTSSARSGLNYQDIMGTLLKSVTFGLFVAVIGCRTGFRTYGGTVGVGRSTTQSVVASIVTILISDFFLQKLIMALKGGS
ncbi:MAG TPA: ABC transporter permease [Blastocatellia bacterium]|nr:ABC transporter permease [Blastocatellia bacterium]